ncbi:MAG: membrane dipeptidase [Luteitalea sp.]|nr:membrane dipeptidase [Luteitalea sp.]
MKIPSFPVIVRGASVVAVVLCAGRLGVAPPTDVLARSRQASPPAATDAALIERARAVLERVPLIDGHNDLPWALREKVKYDLTKLDVGESQPGLMTDIPRLRDGGLGGQFWSVYVPASLEGEAAVTATMEQIDAVYLLAEKYADTFEIAGTVDDVERVFKAGKIASLAGVEGGHSIDSSLGTLRMMYRLGARYMTLTHSSNTPWADSATDDPQHGGLTRFGEEVVREMNRLGMLVDLSHVSPDTMADALRVSEAPVIFSHSSARGLTDHPRNVPDDILRELPKNDGVVMITFVPGFVSPKGGAYYKAQQTERDRLERLHPSDDDAQEAGLRAWRKAHPEPTATLADVANHIDHVHKIAGIDHIGIGSDFDGIDSTPEGLEDVSTYPALFAELLSRGYSESDLEKIAGRNALRVMRQVESVATELQSTRAASVATIEQLDGKQ